MVDSPVMNSRMVFDEQERVAEWLAQQINHTARWGDFYAMGIETNGNIVAALVFERFNDSNCDVHVAIKKTSRATIGLIKHGVAYAFGVCGLKRVTALVDADNDKSLQICDRVGFEREAVMKQAGVNGRDVIILALWPDKVKPKWRFAHE